MNGKTSRKVRKEAKKQVKEIVAELLDEPFWVRVKVAFKIVIGRRSWNRKEK